LIQHLQNIYEDELFMNDEILEALHENHFQLQEEILEVGSHNIQ